MAGMEVIAADNSEVLNEFVELPYRLYRDCPHSLSPLGYTAEETLDRANHPAYRDADTEFFVAKKDGRIFEREARPSRGRVNASSGYGCSMLATDGAASTATRLNGIRVRPIDLNRFEADAESVWNVCCAAWERTWGCVPLSKEEFRLQNKEMKQILKPELALIGEVQGRIAGFAVALPDIPPALKSALGKLLPTGLIKILYYQRLVKSIGMLALGVVEEYRDSGLAAVFNAVLIRNVRKLDDSDCEMSWILEDNVLMSRSLEVMGAKRYKPYRIYEWN